MIEALIVALFLFMLGLIAWPRERSLQDEEYVVIECLRSDYGQYVAHLTDHELLYMYDEFLDTDTHPETQREEFIAFIQREGR